MIILGGCAWSTETLCLGNTQVLHLERYAGLGCAIILVVQIPLVTWHLGTFPMAVIFVLSVGGIYIEFLPCQMLHIVSFHHVTHFSRISLNVTLPCDGSTGVFIYGFLYLSPVNQNKNVWRLSLTSCRFPAPLEAVRRLTNTPDCPRSPRGVLGGWARHGC